MQTEPYCVSLQLKILPDAWILSWIITHDDVFLIDIDECNMNIDDCDHSCINTNGSYYCECMSGFRLLANGTYCEGETLIIMVVIMTFKQKLMNAVMILICALLIATASIHMEAIGVIVSMDITRINQDIVQVSWTLGVDYEE